MRHRFRDPRFNIFKPTFDFAGWSVFTFGNAAQPGLTKEFVANDLTVAGTLVGGNAPMGDVDLVYLPVPEPATALLLCAGLFLSLPGNTGRTIAMTLIASRPTRAQKSPVQGRDHNSAKSTLITLVTGPACPSQLNAKHLHQTSSDHETINHHRDSAAHTD